MPTGNDYARILLSHGHVSVTPSIVALHKGKVRVGNLADFLLKYTYRKKFKSRQNISSVSKSYVSVITSLFEAYQKLRIPQCMSMIVLISFNKLS